MRRFGIFPKVFIYTTLFLAAVIAITVGLFYQQFAAFYNAQQMQQLRTNYQRLYDDLRETGWDRERMIEIAQNFSDTNQTFIFRITDEGETPLFLTHNRGAQIPDGGTRMLFTLGGYTLIAENTSPALGDGEFLVTAAFAFAAIMIVALIGAGFFARQMTIPIKRLVADTKKWQNFCQLNLPKNAMMSLVTYQGMYTICMPS